jgi:peptide chain release factor 1
MLRGRGAWALYAQEAGGHRFQRIPPNEKRGRVHTSTVTVALLAPDVTQAFHLDERDVELVRTRGTGPGGQHRNKVESCVIATHRPTGLSARADMRSQHTSKTMALEILAARVSAHLTGSARRERDADRRAQVGAGMRGDKIRTYRTQDDRVTDHRTNRTFSLTTLLRGDWSEIR